MIIPTSNEKFYLFLKEHLPNALMEERKLWVDHFFEQQLDFKLLKGLLFEDRNIALHFSWMISEIGLKNPSYLLKYLPDIYMLSANYETFNFRHSFAKYWRISGIPEVNESEALDDLLDWYRNPKSNISLKKNSYRCLLILLKKYPELEGEIVLNGEGV